MPSRKGRWYVPPCPLCVRWTCECGTVKTNLISSFSVPECTKCGSSHGSSMHAHHYDEALRDEHAALHLKMSQVLVTDHLRIRELMRLKDQLAGLTEEFRVQWRTALRTGTDTPENNLAINLGNEKLLALESVIRDWVKNHPEEDA